MIHVPLVDKQRVLVRLLHIKFSLIKNYVKALNKEGNAFKYLPLRFPYISEAKLKAGIFVGPRIRELLSDQDFKSKMNSVEKHAWDEFEAVVSNFLVNNKYEESQDIVRNMIKTYEALGSRISFKMPTKIFYQK